MYRALIGAISKKTYTVNGESFEFTDRVRIIFHFVIGTDRIW